MKYTNCPKIKDVKNKTFKLLKLYTLQIQELEALFKPYLKENDIFTD